MKNGFFILIKSCAQFAERRRACRETWLRALPCGARYAFVVGRDAHAEAADVWKLDAPDGYRELPQKVLAALRRAVETPGWAWLLVVDDDTAVDAARAVDFVRGRDASVAVLFGHPGMVRPFCCLGGAGMLYSRAAAELVAAQDVPQIGADDRFLTEAALRAGVRVQFSARFGFYRSPLPAADNDRVTGVNVEPPAMRAWWAQRNTDYLEALPPAARPQSCRSLPPAPRRRAAAPAALPDGLVLPRGVRRVVVFSNVTPAPPFELLPGDLCLHLNRARNFPAVRGTQGVTHSLLVRCWEKNGARRWFEPESTDGFWQVLHIMDAPMCARRAWWQKYKADTHKSPTSGFIAWQLAREAAPELPVVLVGFAPGENFGTPLWRGHAWSYEAAAYARERAQIVRPEKQRTDHD